MKLFEYQDENCRGRIERFEYTGTEGARKYALVYLPYGYDSEQGRRYDILYMMHGGGGSPDAWLDSCPFKNMLDRSIASGEVRPLIVVFPSFYKTKSTRKDGEIDHDFEHASVLSFQKELTEQLIPALEGKYRGFAEGTDPDALKKARNHRGFGGFSMGGVNTWYACYLHIDYFSVFLPLSGDFWLYGEKAGSKKPRETAEALRHWPGRLRYLRGHRFRGHCLPQPDTSDRGHEEAGILPLQRGLFQGKPALSAGGRVLSRVSRRLPVRLQLPAIPVCEKP